MSNLFGTVGEAREALSTPDFTSMDDDQLKKYCKKLAEGDVNREVTCLRGAIEQRREEKCETVKGVTKCCRVVASELAQGFLAPPPDVALIKRPEAAPAPAPSESTFGPSLSLSLKNAVMPYSEGYTSDGNPARRTFPWVILVLTIGVAAWGLV